ncbi:hypothetical protein ACFW6E_45195 [Streptomyces olivaceoviridis]|uniref:hypothetical protein n=1 Tax=Streptomyces olivaceoviridis TaxID=1921 RepID=UPI0036B5EF6C
MHLQAAVGIQHRKTARVSTPRRHQVALLNLPGVSEVVGAKNAAAALLDAIDACPGSGSGLSGVPAEVSGDEPVTAPGPLDAGGSQIASTGA